MHAASYLNSYKFEKDWLNLYTSEEYMFINLAYKIIISQSSPFYKNIMVSQTFVTRAQSLRVSSVSENGLHAFCLIWIYSLLNVHSVFYVFSNPQFLKRKPWLNWKIYFNWFSWKPLYLLHENMYNLINSK